MLSLPQYSCRLLIRINRAATFRLLEGEAGKATYKEFIHSGKNAFINTDKHEKSQLRTFGKQYNVLVKSYLGFCKKSNTDDTNDTDENNTGFLMLYTGL